MFHIILILGFIGTICQLMINFRNLKERNELYTIVKNDFEKELTMMENKYETKQKTLLKEIAEYEIQMLKIYDAMVTRFKKEHFDNKNLYLNNIKQLNNSNVIIKKFHTSSY